MQGNILLQTNSYKQTHWRMYPPGTSEIESCMEARRGGKYRPGVVFGLQYLLKRCLDHHGGGLPAEIRAVREERRVPASCAPFWNCRTGSPCMTRWGGASRG